MGSILLALIFISTGLLNDEVLVKFFSEVARFKVSIPYGQMFMRAVMCNFIVCMAVLLCYRTDNDATKIMLIIMCIFTFVVVGFEHSIANMSVYSIAILSGSINSITITEAVIALLIATFGNLVSGGILLGGGIFLLKK